MIDTEMPIDISIPLRFNGPQPNAYSTESASSQACESGMMVGDTRRGGSVNFERVSLIPHCNGTHTECIGHISNDRVSVLDCLQDVLMRATLVSAKPERSSDGDNVITREALNEALTPRVAFEPKDACLPTALIVRTLPNDESKLGRIYNAELIPPYFMSQAIELIVECGFKHLLVDMPSIDRIFDQGKLVNHRLFWNVEPGSHQINSASRVNSTITELIYVPNEIEDGEYLLNLQIAPFASDASPSRPVLFSVK